MTQVHRATRYRWSDLPKESPLPSAERRRVIGEQVMISEVLLQPGCVVPMHAHANEQIACVISGRIRFTIGGEGGVEDHQPIVLGAGEVLHLPANCPHAAEALEETLVLDVFSPPSETTGIDRAS